MNIPCPYCKSNDTKAVFSNYDVDNKNIIHGIVNCNFCHEHFSVEKNYEEKTIKVNNHFLGWRVK